MLPNCTCTNKFCAVLCSGSCVRHVGCVRRLLDELPCEAELWKLVLSKNRYLYAWMHSNVRRRIILLRIFCNHHPFFHCMHVVLLEIFAMHSSNLNLRDWAKQSCSNHELAGVRQQLCAGYWQLGLGAPARFLDRRFARSICQE